MTTTDRIEKTIVLRAPLLRVWEAISDHEKFGAWFRARFDTPFVAGQRTQGKLTVEQYAHLTIEIFVERVEPETLLSFRWHPYAIDAEVDYSTEPLTLVEFRLEALEAGGTRLTVTESGFDALPASRRDLAFRMNEGGWAVQVQNIERYVDR
jgi:uncharacterized protein YndB with AHSA1/START domain